MGQNKKISELNEALFPLDNAVIPIVQGLPLDDYKITPKNLIENVIDTMGLVEEAPEDGKQYARKNKDWVEVQGGGTTVTKTSELTNDGGDGVHPFITLEDVPTTDSSK